MICKDSIFASHGSSRGYRFLFGPATTSSTTTTTPPDDGQDYSTSEEGDQGDKDIYKLWSDLSSTEYQEAVAFLVANPGKVYPRKMEKDVQQAAAAAALVAPDSVSDSAGVIMAGLHKDHAANAPATADNEDEEEQEQYEILEHGRGDGRDAPQHHHEEEPRSLSDELMDMDMDSDQLDVEDDMHSSSNDNDLDPQIDDDDDGDAATNTQDQHLEQRHPHCTPLLRQDDIWDADSVVPSVQPLSQPTFQSMSSLTPPPQIITTKTGTLSFSSFSPAAVSQAKSNRLKTSISSSSSPFFHAGSSPQQSHPPQQPGTPHVQQLWDMRLVKALKAYDNYGNDEDEEEEEEQGRRDWVQHGQHEHQLQLQHGTRQNGGDSDGVLKFGTSTKKVAGARRNKKSLWPEL